MIRVEKMHQKIVVKKKDFIEEKLHFRNRSFTFYS